MQGERDENDDPRRRDGRRRTFQQPVNSIYNYSEFQPRQGKVDKTGLAAVDPQKIQC